MQRPLPGCWGVLRSQALFRSPGLIYLFVYLFIFSFANCLWGKSLDDVQVSWLRSAPSCSEKKLLLCCPPHQHPHVPIYFLWHECQVNECFDFVILQFCGSGGDEIRRDWPVKEAFRRQRLENQDLWLVLHLHMQCSQSVPHTPICTGQKEWWKEEGWGGGCFSYCCRFH